MKIDVSVIAAAALLATCCKATEFRFPSLIRDKGEESTLDFQYDAEKSFRSPEVEVITFCEKYSICRKFCSLLMDQVMKTLLRFGEFTFSRIPLSDGNRSYLEEVPEVDVLITKSALQSMQSPYCLHSAGCFVFVHVSTSAPEKMILFMSNVFEVMESNGFWEAIDVLYVLWYGPAVGGLDSLLLQFPKAHWFYRSPSPVSHAFTSLTHIQHFVHKLEREKSANVLFLNFHDDILFGASSTYLSDWIDMVLYFLVEQHQDLFHLLRSGEFDVLGVNYLALPRMFQGNMWWATASYLRRLPDPNNYLSNSTSQEAGDGSDWLFATSTPTRVYLLHDSNIDHTKHPYPRSQYSSRDRVQSSVIDAIQSLDEDVLLEMPEFNEAGQRTVPRVTEANNSRITECMSLTTYSTSDTAG